MSFNTFSTFSRTKNHPAETNQVDAGALPPSQFAGGKLPPGPYIPPSLGMTHSQYQSTSAQCQPNNQPTPASYHSRIPAPYQPRQAPQPTYNQQQYEKIHQDAGAFNDQDQISNNISNLSMTPPMASMPTGLPRPHLFQNQHTSQQQEYQHQSFTKNQQNFVPQQQQYMPTPMPHRDTSSSTQYRSLIPDDIEPCHPNYISMTVGAIPNTKQLKIQSRIPLGFILHPMAVLSPGVNFMQTVNFGGGPVIRCRDCRTYINAYVQFLDASRWCCNLCNRANEVPSAYYAALDHQKRRVDRMERPELSCSSYEIIAPSEYTVRPPMPPVYYFVIDVSVNSIRSGMLRLVCQTILETLDQLPGGSRTLIGLLTFCSVIHFYSLKSTQSAPQMIVSPDLDDIFLPQPDELLVNLEESRGLVDALLESLPDMHKNTQDVECALGSAVVAAEQAMQHIGGKMLIFSCGLPSIGVGRLQNREQVQLLGTDKEHTLLKKSSDFYKTRSILLSRLQISCDIFQFSDRFVDVASVSHLAKHSGGSAYYYPKFNADIHGVSFQGDLIHDLTRQTGWEAVMRVRVSKGMKTTKMYGHFNLRGKELVTLPSIDSDKAFAFELHHDEQHEFLNIKSFFSVQAALLYTTSSGERRIRVHTMALPIVNSLSELFPRVSVPSVCNLLAKNAIDEALSFSLRKCRELIQNTCIALLRSYRATGRQFISLESESNYPEYLRLLPLMTLGLLKCDAFRDGTDIPTDVRASSFRSIQVSGVQELELFLRPRIIPLHEVLHGKTGMIAPSGECILPEELNSSFDGISSESAILVDNGKLFVLRLSRKCPTVFLENVFGISSLDEISSYQLKVKEPSVDGKTNGSDSILTRVQNILSALRSEVSSFQHLNIVIEGEPEEQRFYNLLIEDRSSSVMGYQEFLQFIIKNTGM